MARPIAFGGAHGGEWAEAKLSVLLAHEGAGCHWREDLETGLRRIPTPILTLSASNRRHHHPSSEQLPQVRYTHRHEQGADVFKTVRMRDLTDILKKATKDIDLRYMQLPIDGGIPIYRERVYCYELYHQMRSRWPVNCDWVLNGEVDKRAHPILIGLGAAGTVPDLLVHKPGYMGGNHAIIEIKPVTAARSAMQDDVHKLAMFRTNVGYARAVLLVYGLNADQVISELDIVPEPLIDIELWAHSHAGQPMKHIRTVGTHDQRQTAQ